MRGSRGYALVGAMLVIVSLAAVVSVGFALRDRDLGFEARSLRRHQARWAAESGLARARARRARRVSVEVAGELPPHLVCDRIAYRVRTLGGRWLRAEGRCVRRGRVDVRAAIEVVLSGTGRGRIAQWREDR